MIPYFKYTVIPVGPVNIQVWGLFVVLGIVSALAVGRHLAAKRGLDKEVFTDLASWCILAGLAGARIFYSLAYAPGDFLHDPFSILRVWEGGMSMFGGLLGGAAGALFFARRHPKDVAAYADTAAFVLPLGYAISRIGCFLIHDHPGTLSNSFLAVRYPDGPRLDHGFLLAVAGLIIFKAFWMLERRIGNGAKPEVRPRYLPLFMVCYGAVRLVLDFYRASDLAGSDVRYFGLTPAQYISLVLIIIGSAALMRNRPRLHAIFP